MLAALRDGIESADQDREALPDSLAELRAIGVVVVLEGADAAYPLKLGSLDRLSAHTTQPKRPLWTLLSVAPETDDLPERATVWISDAYRERFLRLFEDYINKQTPNEHPRNRELVANIGRIREAVIDDLWQSSGRPTPGESGWWEIWLTPGAGSVERLEAYVAHHELRLADRVLRLNDRTVSWVHGDWAELERVPFTSVPVTEIRRPEFAETIEDLMREDRDELAEDLLDRLQTADAAVAPVVCHLDTGIRQSHALLTGSLAAEDVHTVVGTTDDRQNHGTQMAGLGLYGSLEPLLLSGDEVTLYHRLESVKILPDSRQHDSEAYGLVTAQAVSLPEATATRRRVFCMPISAPPDRDPGEPSLWSASVDALAAGVNIAASDDGIELLGAPEMDQARLFVVATGNLSYSQMRLDYEAQCDLAAVEDPAHAWNALTVGGFTELDSSPTDPSFNGWFALAGKGRLSPHSRTSVMFGARTWPIKPDICMEAGNVITDGTADFVMDHPVASLRTTDARDDLALSSTNATSAATAQAARLAAMAHAYYPDYWPETVRGLLTHQANWTPAMRTGIDGATSKTERLSLLRRYGWGVPREENVIGSTAQAVTMVTQDTFSPFEGKDFLARRFRLHELPWPVEVLRGLGAADVSLRVTLSYFIEPAASRRGWRRRYTYPSHGLRFELKRPTETADEFLRRLNYAARREEEGSPGQVPADQWLVGPNQRNFGSLHQDVWDGSGADLAEAGYLAVHPVGGWWKNNRKADRADREVRYALLVSLTTSEVGVDLYTPIATQLELPVEVVVPAT